MARQTHTHTHSMTAWRQVAQYLRSLRGGKGNNIIIGFCLTDLLYKSDSMLGQDPQKEPLQIAATGVLQAECVFCRTSNSIKKLKKETGWKNSAQIWLHQHGNKTGTDTETNSETDRQTDADIRLVTATVKLSPQATWVTKCRSSRATLQHDVPLPTSVLRWEELRPSWPNWLQPRV